MGKQKSTCSVKGRMSRSHLAVSPCSRAGLKQGRVPNQSGSVRLATCSLGYSRAHPLIWEFCRSQGLMLAGGIEENNDKRRMVLKEGSRILVHAPASQNGTGVLGIGWITSGPSPPFAPGVPDNRDDAAVKDTTLEIKQTLKKIYSDPKNQPVKWRSCDRKGEPTGEHELKVAHLSWDFGQQWARGSLFKKCQDRRYFHFRVRWEATVPWDAGISFNSIGLVTPLSEVAFRWTSSNQCSQILALLSSGCSTSTSILQTTNSSSLVANTNSEDKSGVGEHVARRAGKEHDILGKLQILKDAFDQGLVTMAVYEQKQMQILAAL